MFRRLLLVGAAAVIVGAVVGVTMVVMRQPQERHFGPATLAQGRVGDRSWRAVGEQVGPRACVRVIIEPDFSRSGTCREALEGGDSSWGIMTGPRGRSLFFGNVSIAVASLRIEWRDGSVTTVRPFGAPWLARRFWIAEVVTGLEMAKMTVFDGGDLEIEHSICAVPDGTGCAVFKPGERE